MPNGTTFSKPVTLTFHYTDAEVPDNIPYFLFIAYQDSSGAWRTDFKQHDVDTVAKTVSLDINHFTIFSGGDAVPMQADAKPLTLRENETSKVWVIESVLDNRAD